MSYAVIPFVIAASLSGAVTTVFVMLVTVVRAGDGPGRLSVSSPRSQLESLTRILLGAGVRADDDLEG
jgi:hypothetical protein